MIHKYTHYFLILVVCLTISACGSNTHTESKKTEYGEAQTEDDPSEVSTEAEEPLAKEADDLPSDEDFMNNLKLGLQDRWDQILDEEEIVTPEQWVDFYIDSCIGAEKRRIGTLEDYSFRNDSLRSLAVEYYSALDVTEKQVTGMLLYEDEDAEAKFNEATKECQDIIKQLMADYGLEFDEKYKIYAEEFLGITTEVRSACHSGYEIEDKLKGSELCVDGVGYDRDTSGQALLVAKVKNNTDKALKNARISFVAWDNDDHPIKLYNGYYIVVLDYEDINISPGNTGDFEDGVLVSVPPEEIGRIAAIVTHGEYSGGEIYESPYYEEWAEVYAGVDYKEATPNSESTVAVDQDAIPAATTDDALIKQQQSDTATNTAGGTDSEENTQIRSDRIVYITPKGKCYHYDIECAGNNAISVSYEYATSIRRPCGTCVY